MRTRLTTGEAAAFKKKVWPMLRLLTRARKRIDELGFDPKSKLYVTIGKAQDALQSLHIELHYQSISHGAGLPSDEPDGPTGQAPGEQTSR
jgi:hypothetical protein